MNLTIILTGLLVLSFLLLPFFLTHFSRIKKESQLITELQQYASQHQSSITEYETGSDFAMGLDEQKNQLFFVKHNKAGNDQQHIDINQYRRCKVNKQSRPLGGKSNNGMVTELLHLDFYADNAKNKSLRLYDEKINLHLSGELQFAERWAKKING
ncbi:MAG: hypothetical protein ACK4GL_00685 [Flavobacteriales bacterium]